MLAVWAEMDAVLADEFRDGNVPAQMAPLTVAKAAFAALPKTVTTYYYRGDSACHEKELLRWLSNERREEGPQGRIGFAISVDAISPHHSPRPLRFSASSALSTGIKSTSHSNETATNNLPRGKVLFYTAPGTRIRVRKGRPN